MTFEEALAQTMSIAGLLDLGGRRILDTDGFQALLGNAQRQRPIVINRAARISLSTALRAAPPLRFAGSSTPRSSRCEAVDRMMSCVSVSFGIGISIRLRGVARRRHHLSPTVAMRLAGPDPDLLLAPGTVAVPLRSQPNASPFWIMLLLVSGRLDTG